ncbi:6265_t:CDS:2 [Ambispora leptoticha]|uniref:6265_t:CDS:1 n=1 Tax=Ambispora leptoticha TaxID=144679 RepID=A0A9N9C1K9_9GLOM|nr:6265_t:CDS:2 [Ambispora leptoticha]
MIKKNITGITRNYRDAGETSSRATVTSTNVLPEIDIPEDLSLMDIYEEPMQIDSSDNDSAISNDSSISSYQNDFSFITKKAKKGKKPVGNGERRSSQNITFVENLFSDEEENVVEDLSDVEDKELSDQDIDFNAPENLINETEQPIGPIDVLKVQFIRYLLILHDENTYSSSPSTLNIACKNLGVCAHMIKYATCEQCCKLYNTADVSTEKANMAPKVTQCTFQEFLNHPMANYRCPCNYHVAKKVPVTKGVIYRLSLIYPTVSLKHQFQLLFNRKEFEASYVELANTHESSTSKFIRAAVICCSCDIPAARKLCGHISAWIAYHQCLKRANFDERNQPNFGGFADMSQWFVERDIEEIRQNTITWKDCNTEDARRSIAKWIVKLWIDEEILTSNDLALIENRAKKIMVPTDIGKIPYKIAIGEDYGPLYAFWCFSYEKMNGLLGSFNSSNRRIEPELLKIMQYCALLDELSSHAEGYLQACLQFIEQKTMNSSLAIYDGNDCREFLSMFVNIEEKSGTGFEPFPSELLGPMKERQKLPKEISALLKKYYNNAYNYNFVSLAKINIGNLEAILVLPTITIHGRIKIGDEVFGSTYSKRQPKYSLSSY